jgi:hypothetical protein
VAFGGILIARPGDGALAVLWLIAAYAIVVGACSPYSPSRCATWEGAGNSLIRRPPAWVKRARWPRPGVSTHPPGARRA